MQDRLIRLRWGTSRLLNADCIFLTEFISGLVSTSTSLEPKEMFWRVSMQLERRYRISAKRCRLSAIADLLM